LFETSDAGAYILVNNLTKVYEKQFKEPLICMVMNEEKLSVRGRNMIEE